LEIDAVGRPRSAGRLGDRRRLRRATGDLRRAQCPGCVPERHGRPEHTVLGMGAAAAGLVVMGPVGSGGLAGVVEQGVQVRQPEPTAHEGAGEQECGEPAERTRGHSSILGDGSVEVHHQGIAHRLGLRQRGPGRRGEPWAHPSASALV
jgi:hypothetical protein